MFLYFNTSFTSVFFSHIFDIFFVVDFLLRNCFDVSTTWHALCRQRIHLDTTTTTTNHHHHHSGTLEIFAKSPRSLCAEPRAQHTKIDAPSSRTISSPNIVLLIVLPLPRHPVLIMGCLYPINAPRFVFFCCFASPLTMRKTWEFRDGKLNSLQKGRRGGGGGV